MTAPSAATEADPQHRGPQVAFRFGVGPGGLFGSAAVGWRETVTRYEALGYSTVCVGDHLSMQGPLPALAAAAAWTERIGVGVMVADNDYRSPLLLAQDAATVQALSGGRLELGLGAGWDPADYRQLGLDFERPGVRIERLRESVDIVKRYLGGEGFSYSGRHYVLDDVRPLAVPVAEPPKLMIGGGGRQVLALAAREADIVSINLPLNGADLQSSIRSGAAAADWVAGAVETVRQAAGDRFCGLELHVNVVYCDVVDDAGPQLAAAAKALSVDPGLLADSPFVLIGDEDDIADKLQRLRRRLGISYYTVDAGAAEALAPVVARMTGT